MNVNVYVWIRAVFAAVSGFLFGYDVGAISGVIKMEGFQETIGISSESENATESLCDDDNDAAALLGLIVSLFSIGATTGALLAGALSDFVGRKLAMVTGAVLYGVGGALQTAAYFLWMVVFGRTIAGIGIGILFMVVPVYIAEIAPKKLRGRLISILQLALTFGILTGYIVNLVVQPATFGWRISLGVEPLSGLILATGMLFLPETPRWLAKKHKDQKAEKVLTKIHQSNVVIAQEELKDIQDRVQSMEKSKESLWTVVFSWRYFQRVLLGIILMSSARLVGINLISIYSVTIFCKIGIPPFIGSVAQGLVIFLSSLTTFWLPDKFGRKPLLLIGALGMMASMLVAGTLILVFRVEEGGNTVAGVLVVVFIFAYGVFFPGTYGSVPFVFVGEVYPLKIRGIAVSLASAALWASDGFIGFIGSVLLASPLQTYGTLYLLAGFQLMTFVFVLLTLPETKGVSLEGMDALFQKPWIERTNILYHLRCGCFCRRKKVVITADGYDIIDDSDNPPSSIDHFEATEVSGGFDNPLHVFDNSK